MSSHTDGFAVKRLSAVSRMRRSVSLQTCIVYQNALKRVTTNMRRLNNALKRVTTNKALLTAHCPLLTIPCSLPGSQRLR